ncbi:hypothetical protein ACA910_012011 [Epithemia clementina (nom. ined.)]
MGLTTSPYQATQSAQCVKYLALGNCRDPRNVFCWDQVELNLPCDNTYDPSLAWVRQVRIDGQLAADVHPYVDDLRETAATEAEAWDAASRMAKTDSYYGLQDAAQKRRAPSLTPGAWAGALAESTKEGVYKMVSDECWQKVQIHVRNLEEWARQNFVDRKLLERTRDFLVYVTMTYGAMTPYLKGIHLTLDSWRGDRDEDGWKMSPAELAMLSIDANGPRLEPHLAEDKAPALVAPVSRLKEDVEALKVLTQGATPPRVRVRLTKSARAAMMFGDASGSEFRLSLWIQGATDVVAEHGVWTRSYGS